MQENGQDYLLTAVKMEDYLKLYESSTEDRQNPYFAPILAKDLSHMPETLILTAEFDPLRDEGEEYGKRLKKQIIMWKYIGFRMHFMDILHWGSGFCMYRKVLRS